MPDSGLVQLVARAHNWFGRIAGGASTGPADIAAQDKAARTDVSRTLPLAFLAPDIVRAILEGRHPPDFTPSILARSASRLPSDWNAQRQMLGFPQV